MNAQQQLPVPHGSMLHKPLTILLLLAAKQEPYKKAYLFTKNTEEFCGKSSDNGPAEKEKKRKKSAWDGKSNWTRQKNK